MQAFRAQELLLSRATEGLSEAEAAELEALGADDDVSFELSASALDIATIRYEDMPAGLADKVLLQAGVRPSGMTIPTTLPGVLPQRLAQPERLSQLVDTPMYPHQSQPQMPYPAPQPEAQVIPITQAPKRSRAPMFVAYFAAAAGIAVGIGAFLWAQNKEPERITVEVPVIKAPVQPSPKQARADLLANAKDVRTLSWAAGPDETGKKAAGDIVWSVEKQEGYMRFTGLAANDPKLEQYQLWMFDKDRGDKYPVDGGVFDVIEGEVVVKISAKLIVKEPVFFAVTVEQPGGVVVSDRKRIAVTATPPKTG
jgi:hypothetical protein